MRHCTGKLEERRIIAPVRGSGGVTLLCTCPHCNSFLLEDCFWWVSTGKKHCSWWCAICGGAPNRILLVQIGTNEDEAKVFRAHAIPQELCENLINALQLLANQQKDGDGPIQNITVGLEEKCRERVTNGLRSFFTSDKQCSGGGSLV